MALPQTTREQIVTAIGLFDQTMRDRAEWQNWTEKRNHKYAIEFNSSLYPVKAIVALATGRDATTFSGGPEANGFLQKLGFTIKSLRTTDPQTSLQSALLDILREFPLSKQRSRTVSNAEPSVAAFRRAVEALRNSDSVLERDNISVEFSPGQGNWAAVPWIALFDRSETQTIQNGRYVVFLFRSDCSGVYLTLNQGVTKLHKELGRAGGADKLRELAASMRTQVNELAAHGFALDHDIQLSAKGLGADYAASTVAHKFYAADAIPDDAQLQADVEAVLAAYEKVLGRSRQAKPRHRAWIFQANPSAYDLAAAVSALKELCFTVNQNAAAIQVGDRVYLWESGPAAGVVAVAEVTAPVAPRPDDAASLPFQREPTRFEGDKPRVILAIRRVLAERLPRSRLLNDPALASLAFLRAPQGTNFAISEAHEQAIEALLQAAPKADLRPNELCAAFSQALHDAGLSFGAEHDPLVRSFFASVLAKPFVILTGLSGSGKTQLALKLGEWFGDDRHRVIPVRPDWTGPESLLGYEDALLPVENGQRAWSVPEALQLMLAAARDPDHPYLLALDEMNLAHVERYFADVLSGVESRKEILPNLERDASNYFRLRLDGPAKLPMPRNLIIIGTVNVDETTYMFSPKVLDRANTLEFRVATDALPADPREVSRPTRAVTGSGEQLASLLTLLLDDSWHRDNSRPELKEFAEEIRKVHAELARHGYEFGHRTYYEALRLAAFLLACGIDQVNAAVDVFLLQKVLPRLHGARRKLEPVLVALGRYSFDRIGRSSADPNFDVKAPPLSPPPLMPRTFAKVQRMTRALHANQFASFSD